MARWDGRERLVIDREVTGEEPAAVLVQTADYGPIVAAGLVR